MGTKESVYPRLLHKNTQVAYALRMIMQHAFKNKINYKNLTISIAYSIIEHALGLANTIRDVKLVNRLSYLNRHQLFNRQRSARVLKYRLIKYVRN